MKVFIDSESSSIHRVTELLGGDSELVYPSLSPPLFIQLLYCSSIHTAVVLSDGAAVLVSDGAAVLVSDGAAVLVSLLMELQYS